MIGFQRGINLIFSLFNEGDNIVFSLLRFENDFDNNKIYKFIILKRQYYANKTRGDKNGNSTCYKR